MDWSLLQSGQLIQLLHGRFGMRLSCLLLTCYLLMAFEPFSFHYPQRVRNGAERTRQGTVAFPKPGLIVAPAPAEWLQDCIDAEELRVHVRARPYRRVQTGPARLFTLSANSGLRNITISQEGASLDVRVRTSATCENAEPSHTIGDMLPADQWSVIDVQVQRSTLEVSVDERIVLVSELSGPVFGTWNRGFRVALGNEVTGDRPWLGEISDAKVSVREQEFDYLQPGSTRIPEYYRPDFYVQPFRFLVDFAWKDQTQKDTLLNFLCFVPVGFVLATQFRTRAAIIGSGLVCSLTSLVAEAGQILVPGRVPAVTDWLLNTMGGIIGAVLLILVVHRAKLKGSGTPDPFNPENDSRPL